jgi:hypothetical protein
MRQDLERFILEGARRITPASLGRLIRQLPEIRLSATQVTEFPPLPDDAAIINLVFETYNQPFLDHVLARKAREELS